MENLIASMLKGGFYRLHMADGSLQIAHDKYGVFSSWEEALITCIEVATEQ